MTRDSLDQAIDHVAARLTAVGDDDRELAHRILGQLPQRTSRLRWLVPQLAAIGAIAIVALTWRHERAEPGEAVLTSSARAWATALAQPVHANVPDAVASPRSSQVETAYVLAVEVEKGDFARALPAIEAMPALALSELSPAGITAPPALEVAPIAIAEIPMTADVPPRR